MGKTLGKWAMQTGKVGLKFFGILMGSMIAYGITHDAVPTKAEYDGIVYSSTPLEQPAKPSLERQPKTNEK